MNISIVICTRNRCSSLRRTLNSVTRSAEAAPYAVEIVVVDNGSVDNTRDIVSAVESKDAPIKYLFEGQLGQSHSRNVGIRSSVGDVILFTDDDVIVPSNWVQEMCTPILGGHCEAVQGGIHPAEHLERPWLRGMLRVWVACVEDPVHAPEGLVGANMAFSRRAYTSVGGFQPRLGPGAAGFYDDTVFGWMLKRAGIQFCYLPEVSVEHHFSEVRLGLRSFMLTAQKMAYSRVLADELMSGSRQSTQIQPLLPQIPGFIFRCLTQALRAVLFGRPDVSFLSRYFHVILWFVSRGARR